MRSLGENDLISARPFSLSVQQHSFALKVVSPVIRVATHFQFMECQKEGRILVKADCCGFISPLILEGR